MITIKHASAALQVSPANAEPTRALLALIDKSKGLKGRKFKRASDPKHDSMKREYPTFHAGMTTGEYLSHYSGLNHKRVNLAPVEYMHADRAAPMLDASMPEMIEEVDA
jgi:hypothetical protein